MIFDSFLKTLGQIGDPKFRTVLWRGIGLSLLLLVLIYAVFVVLIKWLVGPTVTLPLLGEVGWVDDLVSFGSFFFMLFLSVFLMIPVASAFTSLFLEEVAQAVEDKHYPHLPKAESVPVSAALVDTARFLGLLIAANIVALFIYLLLPISTLFLFWGLNGLLLGREYFTLAASRRIGMTATRELRQAHLPTIWIAGTLMAIPLSVPLLNLVIPILGAACFTHIFHQISRKAAT